MTQNSTDTTPQTRTDAAALPSAFTPADVETELYERWVERGYFEADESSDKPPFCMVIPPPNVTGSLHIGHAFEHTLIDAVTRRRRMQGYEALWLPGMDHAGIATQTLVERQLAAEGSTRQEVGREAFVDRVWRWKEESGGAILGQMRRLGDGVDWRRQRFTMDDGLSRSVQTMFSRLYADGLIYRANRMVNWSPALRSAISDIEVDHRDVEGELVSIRYGDGDDALVVATTRVETMLGDTAVAVHPDDARYTHLVGREIELPLTGRSIPVVADSHVDPEFGTGAVKVTPAHDPNDLAIAGRHDLPLLSIMDETGTIAGSGTEFDGMDRAEAQVAVREALRAQGRVVAEKRPYVHSVGHCSRTGVPIEPRLSEQWFVDVSPLAKAAGDAVRDGRVAIHPPEMASRWFAWVDNMHDWTISRQLWWGHRIPVWHGPDGAMVCVGPDEEPPQGPEWVQDPDVLDTWFSSALWPFSTLGWPEQTPSLAKFYPNQLMLTGYDILFFWVARMMMFGLYAHRDAPAEQAPPFPVIALHGMVRDERGKKMSKSAGNVVDPLEWMDAYGADALRFALARGANPGIDVPIAEEWVQGARNFSNKLWNATRFALSRGAVVGPLPAPVELSVPDRWILSRLHTVTASVDALYEDFQFAKACELLYHFVWDELCDWYLELVKPSLFDDERPDAPSRLVLGHVLDVVLRLLHPVTPFVTEVLWTTVTGEESVVVSSWPQAETRWHDPAAEAEVAELQELVTQVRRFRSDQGLAPKQKVAARVSAPAGGPVDRHDAEVRALLGLAPAGDDFAATASLAVGEVRVELDTSGAIDVEAERRRLSKDLAAAHEDLAQAARKLDNEQFLAKAPEKVVAGIRERRGRAEAAIAQAEAALAALTARATPTGGSA